MRKDSENQFITQRRAENFCHQKYDSQKITEVNGRFERWKKKNNTKCCEQQDSYKQIHANLIRIRRQNGGET